MSNSRRHPNVRSNVSSTSPDPIGATPIQGIGPDAGSESLQSEQRLSKALIPYATYITQVITLSTLMWILSVDKVITDVIIYTYCA